jgi:rhodanese-related sulfurtransferase
LFFVTSGVHSFFYLATKKSFSMKAYAVVALPLLICLFSMDHRRGTVPGVHTTEPSNHTGRHLTNHETVTGVRVSAYDAPVQAKYVCTPCGNDCDKTVYDKPGSCSQCHMALIDKNTIGYKDIDFKAVCDRVKANPKVVLLDVRSPGEFGGTSTDVPTFGHLKNAINVNINELESRIGELNKYKDQEVIVYCSHSHRSPRASYYLATHGFKNVKNVAGGVSTLEAAVPACLDKIYVKHAH